MKTTNRKNVFVLVQVFGLLFIAVMALGFDWMNIGFSLDQLGTGAYWQKIALQMLMYTSALILGYLGTMESQHVDNAEYIKIYKQYRDMLVYKKESFITYIDDTLNPTIKKEAIRTQLSKKLYKLDKHSVDSDKIQYKAAIVSGDIETYKFYPTKVAHRGNLWSIIHLAYIRHRAKKYSIERQKLNNMSDSTYIDENYEDINIKYTRVYSDLFSYSINGTHGSDGDKYNVVNNSGKELSFVVSRKMINMFFTAVVFGAVLWEPDILELLSSAEGIAIFICQSLMKVAIMLICWWNGKKSGKEVFYRNFVLVLYHRIDILKGYINWSHIHGENTPADKFVEAYNNNLRLKQELEATITEAEKIKIRK